MADKKVTKMVLKVDLQCPRCYKKIKKILCKFSQIRDWVSDEKQNTVTITVVCCSPEKIRDKLCCKGGKTIKSIEIVVPTKPKPEPEPKPPAPAPAPKKEPEMPMEPGKPQLPAPAPKKEPERPMEPERPVKSQPPAQAPAPAPAPSVQGYAPVYPTLGVCYDGWPRPCHCGCGRPGPCYDAPTAHPPQPPPQPQPQPCYCGCGRSAPCYDGYYGSKACSVYYFNDENPSACTIM